MDEARTQLDKEWGAFAKKLLRAAMLHCDYTYGDLVKALAVIGVEENERVLRNKVARGTFSAAFLLQALTAMNIQTLDLSFLTAPSQVGMPIRLGFPIRWRETKNEEE